MEAAAFVRSLLAKSYFEPKEKYFMGCPGWSLVKGNFRHTACAPLVEIVPQ
jgi:hypothetical protein